MPDAKLDEIVTKTKKKIDTDASLDLRICGIGPRYDNLSSIQIIIV